MKPYFERDGITIYHGRAEDVLPTLEPKAHLVITSPPYFNAREYSGSVAWADYAAYAKDLGRWIGAMAVVLEPGRVLCVNVSSVIEPRASRSARSVRHNIPGDVHTIAQTMGLWFLEDIIWAKPDGAAVNRNQRFTLDRHPLQWRANPVTEHILVYQAPTRELNDAIIARYERSWRVDGAFQRTDLWAMNPAPAIGHPAPFPDALPSRLIRYYSWPGDVVVDPFMGSGTTLAAARGLGRRAVGIDISEAYCEYAARRFDQMVLPLEAS